jgi:uncharacterized protein YjbI with pentapeptide repeats
MANVLTEISAAELVKRLLAGERDFASTRIAPEKGDIAGQEGFEELNRYLQGQDLRETPIIATEVDWQGIKAPGLFFMSTKMTGANLSGADLRGADLRRCELTGANFRGAQLQRAVLNQGRYMEADFTDAMMPGADFYEANFSKARFQGVDFSGAYTLRANFSEADFTDALLTRATFYRSDLRGAIGLETARDLGTCEFKHTVVTKREREIIEAARQALPLFDLREE